MDEARPQIGVSEDESGPYSAFTQPVSDAAHRQIRILAAQIDVSVSTLAIRILEAYTPREIEMLAQAMTEPPRKAK